MSDKPENPPAFPPAITCTTSGDVHHGYDGMTLRDYFAAKMAPAFAIEFAQGDEGVRAGKAGVLPELTAKASYMVADAMLAERLK